MIAFPSFHELGTVMDDIVVLKRQYKMDMQEIWSLVHTYCTCRGLAQCSRVHPIHVKSGGGY